VGEGRQKAPEEGKAQERERRWQPFWRLRQRRAQGEAYAADRPEEGSSGTLRVVVPSEKDVSARPRRWVQIVVWGIGLLLSLTVWAALSYALVKLL